MNIEYINGQKHVVDKNVLRLDNFVNGDYHGKK